MMTKTNTSVSAKQGITLPGVLAIIGLVPIVVAFVIVAFPITMIVLFFQSIYDRSVRRQFRKMAENEGKYIVVVYSDDQRWKEYIEREMLPRLEPFVLAYNRSDWSMMTPQKRLAANMLERWGGKNDYLPSAFAMMPGGEIKTLSFYRPFLKFKHGNDVQLRNREKVLYDLVDTLRSTPLR